MGKNKRFISIKTKIMTSSLVPIIIGLVLISAVIFGTLFQLLEEAAKAELLQVTEKYTADFEKKINEATNYLIITKSNLENDIQSGLNDREQLQKTMYRIFDEYGLLDGSSIYFEANEFDGRDADYIGTEYGTKTSGKIAYYFYKDGGKTAYLPEGLENDIEFDMPHYTEAKKANRPIYTEPTAHVVDGRNIPMFTITYPIQNESGGFIGAVTVDLFLEELYAKLQEVKLYETGYIIIANDKNQIIYSPLYEGIGRSRSEQGLNYSLPQGDENVVYTDAKSMLNGKKSLVSITSVYIPQLDSRFYVSATAPTKEIKTYGYSILVVTVIFSSTIISFIAMLLYYLIGKTMTPIKEITESANKIACGDYDTRIKGDYNDEFAIVKESVNTMADSIEAHISETKNSINILENIMNGLDSFIYVTVPETGEILFINDKMKKHFNLSDDLTGSACFEILQEGFTSRCDFCPCNQLDKEPDEIIVWEEHNTLTNRDYRKTDCYINWLGGVKAHLQHSVDITDLKKYMNGQVAAERKALELKSKKDKAEAAAQAKNDFLARMSHEIRTPMNAVMGMSELILRKELPQDVYENALGIKSASANLLAIINDILDFSKIESGKMEIVETPYLLHSLINDVVGITRIRLIEKPILFDVKVDSKIPACLTGDEIRIRQIVLNLLSNAVKYTNEGYISFSFTSEIVENTATLFIEVADSGIGIKEDDVEKLFGDFTQIDTVKNKGIEGTGLGLAIARSLCRSMGGDIVVRSEYGKGSTFSVSIPQRLEAYEPLASVENPGEKSVLLYETREIYRNSLKYTIENLGVICKCVSSIPELLDEADKYPYLFVSSFVFDSINTALSKLENPPEIVLLSDVTETIAPKDVRLLMLPPSPLPVANLLNDVNESYNIIGAANTSFIANDARVLIVDDIMANLKVAEGLMAPYEMRIETCISGEEAVGRIAEKRYDLVFMDHMMPEMDGLEATRLIREMEGEYFKSLPIVALTANAISGIKEMFIQNGMNDFLAKPIETVKLDVILDKWIPNDKKRKTIIQELPEKENAFVKAMKEVPELDVDSADETNKPLGDIRQLFEALPELYEMADNYDGANALKLLKTISESSYGEETDKLINSLIISFEGFDFESALDLIDEMKGGSLPQ